MGRAPRPPANPAAYDCDMATVSGDMTRRWFRPRYWLGVLALAAVVAYGWFVVKPHVDLNNGVQVLVDAQPYQCDGDQVELYPPNRDTGEPAAWAVRADADLSCVLRFFVSNQSGHDVTINDIIAPFLGPNTGAGVQAVALNPTHNNASEIGGDIDAVWHVDDRLLDGETLYYEIRLAFNPAGCASPGGFLQPHQPVVAAVSTGLVDTIVGLNWPHLGIVGTEASSCDS